jgi:hypothetical protein
MMDQSFALLPKNYRFWSCYPMTCDVAMIAVMMAPASVAVAVLLVALLRIGWE